MFKSSCPYTDYLQVLSLQQIVYTLQCNSHRNHLLVGHTHTPGPAARICLLPTNFHSFFGGSASLLFFFLFSQSTFFVPSSLSFLWPNTDARGRGGGWDPPTFFTISSVAAVFSTTYRVSPSFSSLWQRESGRGEIESLSFLFATSVVVRALTERPASTVCVCVLFVPPSLATRSALHMSS